MMKKLMKVVGWTLLLLGSLYPGLLVAMGVFQLVMFVYQPAADYTLVLYHYAHAVIPGFLVLSLIIFGLGIWLVRR